MLTRKVHAFLAASLLTLILGLTGCGGGGGATGSATPPTTGGTTKPTAGPPAAVLLASSAASIKADGTNSTTITATVVDANNLAVSGATVKFTASSGQLGLSSGVSTSSGSVTIPYSALASSGTVNPTDRTETVTATVVGSSVTAQISIKVTASSLSLILGTSIPTIKTDGSNSTTITATVFDSIICSLGRRKIHCIHWTTGDPFASPRCGDYSSALSTTGTADGQIAPKTLQQPFGTR